ncbi:hypothetical protein ACHAXH_000330 [Discostella pseudostelligera]
MTRRSRTTARQSSTSQTVVHISQNCWLLNKDDQGVGKFNVSASTSRALAGNVVGNIVDGSVVRISSSIPTAASRYGVIGAEIALRTKILDYFTPPREG